MIRKLVLLVGLSLCTFSLGVLSSEWISESLRVSVGASGITASIIGWFMGDEE